MITSRPADLCASYASPGAGRQRIEDKGGEASGSRVVSEVERAGQQRQSN